MPGLELIWLNGSVFAIGGGLKTGVETEIHVADRHSRARRLTVPELLDLDQGGPEGLEGRELGESARAVLAVADLARRSVADGLVHPQLARGGSTWYAFWGATIDEPTQTELDELVALAPTAAGESRRALPAARRPDRARRSSSRPRSGSAARSSPRPRSTRFFAL